MPFVFSKTQKSVAFFVVIGSFMLMAVIIIILKGNRVFSSKNSYYTYLNETYSLTSGTPVRFKGVVVGKVSGVDLLDDFRIKVDLAILRKYEKIIRSDSVIKVSSTLLGASSLSIDFIKGEERPTLPQGSLIYSSDMEEGQDIMVRIAAVEPKGDDLQLKAQQVLDMLLEMKPMLARTVLNVRNITGEIDSTLAGLNGSAQGSQTGRELQQSVYLLKQNLVELKHVLRNLPLVPKKIDSRKASVLPPDGR